MGSEICADFATAACSSYCLRVADGTHDSPKETLTGRLLVTSKNVKGGRLVLESAYFISQEDFDEINRRSKVDQWDLLLTMIGTVGEVCIVESKRPTFAIKNVGLLKCGSEIRAKWLYYFLRSPQGQQLVGQRKKGSTQQYISLTEIRNLPVSYPAKDRDMREVVAVLAALDDRITLLRETNATLEAIAQALFKSWFVDFDPVRAKMEGRAPEGMDEATAALFPDGFVELGLGAVPNGWRWGTLVDIATFQNGYAFKSKDWTSGGHPVVKIGDVKPGVIDLAGCSFVSPETVNGLERFRLERGDLLVGMTGYVGETGLVPSVEPLPYLNQRVGRIAPEAGPAGMGSVYCAVRTSEFKEYAEAQSHGSAQANISGASLMSYPMVISSNEVTVAFNELIAVSLENILSNYEQAQTLATLRDTLLPRLISGQLRLPEAQAQIEERTP
jgi:type I restriction enzyme S subunit